MFSYHLFMFLANLWARSFYGLRVKGKHNIPTQGPCIIVANHFGRMWIDLSLMPAIWPRRRPVMVMYGMPSQEDRQEYNTSRLMILGAKVFPTIVAGPRALGKGLKATREIIKRLSNDEAVLMMLSGEVSWHGELNPARTAEPWIALRSGAPILPCSIYGTYDIWPRWEVKPNLTGKITVRIGQPFTLTDGPQKKISHEMLEVAGEQITNRIQQLLDLGHSK
jgi:1-acyl-sn-glycerol-3-phosphate acyltransferase